ncbi:MAG: translation initiation factor IF-2 [Peptococcaceae bacterium]|nr:translation initiation factor IF-2 [Peptococcaceae bacterium]
MGKKRVHEVAKELNLASKEVVAILNDMGVTVKSHMSTIEDKDIQALKNKILSKSKVKDKPDKDDKDKENTGARMTKSGHQAAENKQPAQQSNQSKGQPSPKASVRLSRYGLGLVDKVPQRPPDRRYVGRPLQFPLNQMPTAKDTKKEPQAPAKPQTVETNDKSKAAPVPPKEVTIPEQKEPVTAPPVQEQHKTKAKDAPKHRPHKPRAQQNKRPEAASARPVTRHQPEHHQGERQERQLPGRPGMQAGGRPAQVRKIPKPPSEVVAQQFDKGMGKQRFGGKKDKEKRDKDQWRTDKSVNEKKVFQHREQKLSTKKKTPKQIEKKPITLTGSLTVKHLAEAMNLKAAVVIKQLMDLGVMATINQEIDLDTAVIVAEELGFPVKIKKEPDIEEQIFQAEEESDPADLEPRPSVVTVMGHVDHGKTSLLDAIRKTNVTASEAGGITQHIGAYQVKHNGKKITFLDTPGHEAFTAMRARGAKVTDIAILVVAADDGVKPQTVEAINHAKAANVPIIVAINKMDKPDANPDRVKQQLTEHGLVPEEWGGDTICVPVSAIKHEGLEDLLEMILLVAEMQDLKANPKKPARGTIIESELDKGRGPVATVLVQDGTLHLGDTLVAGTTFARVRAMMDYTGKRVKKAGPATPVEVLGFSDVPMAGDLFAVVEEKLARQIAQKRQEKKRREEQKAAGRLSLDDVFKRIQEGKVKELPLIIKADVQGSVEAIAQALEKLSTDEVKVHLVHSAVGAISETDVMLAAAANAVIIGFNVRPDANARKAAERENVDIRLYRVIYDAIDDVKAALSGLLEPDYREVVIGRAEVRKVFRASKVGTIAGCYVTEGNITRDAGVRLIRDSIVVHEGKLSSLKRFKDDVREVAQGYECGLTLEKYDDIREEDQLEFFVIEEVQREL